MTKPEEWFDQIAARLLAGEELAALRDLQNGLDQRRSQDDWRATCAALPPHPLHALLLQDPYTHRAYTKPRGIPGDAVMLDYVYGHPASAADLAAATQLGRRIFAGTAGLAPPAQAVRLRRSLAANFVERAAYLGNSLAVVAVAAGHLREYEWVHPVARGSMRWTAIDGDPAAAAVVAHDYPAVVRQPFDLMTWLRRPPAEPIADCLYTLGLLDYLTDAVASRLLAALWASLRPGGRLLAGNFLPHAPGLGYMEAAMGWRLRYRTAQDMQNLLPQAPPRTFTDPVGCCVYLEAHKP